MRSRLMPDVARTARSVGHDGFCIDQSKCRKAGDMRQTYVSGFFSGYFYMW